MTGTKNHRGPINSGSIRIEISESDPVISYILTPLILGTGLLGCFYEHGTVVKQDFDKAVELYKLAKDMVDLQSCYNLGLAYFAGRGVIKNEKEALELVRYAADKGNTDALHFLDTNDERR